jgi:hypothetical protein
VKHTRSVKPLRKGADGIYRPDRTPSVSDWLFKRRQSLTDDAGRVHPEDDLEAAS